MKPFDGRPIRNSLSRFKGVTRRRGRWIAQYYFAKRQPHIIGSFETEVDAARAYDDFALLHRGMDSFLNFRDLGVKTDPVVDGDTALIPLAAGGHFRIDLADLPLVSEYYWNCGSHGGPGGNSGTHCVTLSVLLFGPIRIEDMLVHRNGDHLDFRRDNLAIIPRSIAYGGHCKRPGTKGSVYKGVNPKRAHWQARIGHTHIGTFDTEQEAALAYDDAARKRYGPFAALNLPLPGERSCLQPAA
ncbi:MAG: hypothetical protein U0R19_14605 [Bryobacteraceae bacterium]